MTNDKMDIPDGERIDPEDTDLDLPDLPGDWAWGTANHYHWNHKANVHFGRDYATPGGWLGEIDNYVEDGEERWDIHVRPIVEDGTEAGTPRPEAETIEVFDSLDEAIEAVPAHIATHYE